MDNKTFIYPISGKLNTDDDIYTMPLHDTNERVNFISSEIDNVGVLTNIKGFDRKKIFLNNDDDGLYNLPVVRYFGVDNFDHRIYFSDLYKNYLNSNNIINFIITVSCNGRDFSQTISLAYSDRNSFINSINLKLEYAFLTISSQISSQLGISAVFNVTANTEYNFIYIYTRSIQLTGLKIKFQQRIYTPEKLNNYGRDIKVLNGIYDSEDKCFYLFIKDKHYNLSHIMKYDNITDKCYFLVGYSEILNFSDDAIIDMDLVGKGEEKILTWVDGNNNPRKLLINRALRSHDSNYYDIDKYLYFTDVTLFAGAIPPLKVPQCSYSNSNENVNLIRGNLYQFAYRYIYYDDSISDWSNISDIPLPMNEEKLGIEFIYDIRKNNRIIVKGYVNNTEVKTVEFGFRVVDIGDGQVGSFNVFERQDLEWQFFYGEQEVSVIFDMTKPYDAISNEELNKINNQIPLKANAQEVIKDTIIVYGGITEELDNVKPKIDLSISKEYITPESLITSNRYDSVLTNPGVWYLDLFWALYYRVFIFEYYINNQKRKVGFFIGYNPTTDGRLKDWIDSHGCDQIYYYDYSAIVRSVTDETRWHTFLTHTSGDYYDNYNNYVNTFLQDTVADYLGIQLNLGSYVTLNGYKYKNIITSDGYDYVNHNAIKVYYTQEGVTQQVIYAGVSEGFSYRVNYGYFEGSNYLIYVNNEHLGYVSSIGKTDVELNNLIIEFFTTHGYTVSGNNNSVIITNSSTKKVYPFYLICVRDIVKKPITSCGERHYFAISYRDKYGRTSYGFRNKNMEIFIPVCYSENVGGSYKYVNNKIKFDISHLPPSYAEKYVLLYGGSNVSEKKMYNISLSNIEIKDGYTYIDIPTMVDAINQKYVNLNYDIPDFSKNSYIRFIGIQVGNSIIEFENKTETQIIEVTAEGKLVIPDLRFLNEDIYDNIQYSGVFIEVYVLRVFDENSILYKEIGAYDIIKENDKLYHSGNIRNQNDNQSAQLEIDLKNNFLYYTIEREGSYFGINCFNNFSFLYNSKINYGKPNVINNDIKTTYYDKLIHGGRFYHDSGYNYMFTFDGLENEMKYMNFKYGRITGMCCSGDVLKVIQERKITSIYLSATLAMSADGNEVVVQSDKILGYDRSNFDDYGCSHPLSIAINDNSMYFFDVNNGDIVRNTVNGNNPITLNYKTRAKINEVLRNGIDNYHVCGGWDDYLRIYFLTFKHKEDNTKSVTLGFNELYNRFDGTYTFYPDVYIKCDNNIYSCSHSQDNCGVFLFGHNSNIIGRCIFYNNNVEECYTSIFINDNSSVRKLFRSIAVYSNIKPLSNNENDVIIYESDSKVRYSRILKYELIDSVFRADFLRDEKENHKINLLWNGDLLQGNIAKIRLRYLTDSEVNLRFVETIWSPLL